jgi:KDO2-lipid IV(A) lauroyltransferase
VTPIARIAPDAPIANAASRDLREGGAWTRAQAAKNALLYAAARVALTVLALLPARALRSVGRGAGRAAYWLVPGARRTALANVARVFPAASDRERRALVRAAYATLGAHLGDAVAVLGGSHVPAPIPLDPAAARLLEEARAERGVVFASAHLGPWETVARSLVAAGVPLTTIARESYDPRFTRLYDRLRGQGGVGAIYRGSPGAAARILRALRARAVLGVPMDLRSRIPSVEVPFLGHPASTPVGPARLALRSGAAVVVGTVAPAPGGGLWITATRIRTDDLGPNETAAAAERRLTASINEELSRRILALPEAWPWMHPRFQE